MNYVRCPRCRGVADASKTTRCPTCEHPFRMGAPAADGAPGPEQWIRCGYCRSVFDRQWSPRCPICSEMPQPPFLPAEPVYTPAGESATERSARLDLKVMKYAAGIVFSLTGIGVFILSRGVLAEEIGGAALIASAGTIVVAAVVYGFVRARMSLKGGAPRGALQSIGMVLTFLVSVVAAVAGLGVVFFVACSAGGIAGMAR